MTKWQMPTARRTKFKTGLKPQSRFYKWNKITGPYLHVPRALSDRSLVVPDGDREDQRERKRELKQLYFEIKRRRERQKNGPS